MVVKARRIHARRITHQSEDRDAGAGAAGRQIDVVVVQQPRGGVEVIAPMSISRLIEEKALNRQRTVLGQPLAARSVSAGLETQAPRTRPGPR